MADTWTPTDTTRRKRGLVRRHSPVRAGIALIVAAATIFFFAAPVFWIFWASFKPSASLIGNSVSGVGFTFDNYVTVWKSSFGTMMVNSLMICGIAVVISTVIAACAAYVMSRYRFAYKKWLFGALVITQIFPWIILTTPLFIMFAEMGLINSRAAIVFCYVTITLPFSIYLMIGYLEAVPKDLDEAALMDRCSRLQVLRHIVLPLMAPGLVATATYSFLLMWTEFLLALALLTKTSLKTLPLGLALFFGEDTVDWGAVMAASALTTLPALILFLPVQSRLVAGLSAGSVKG
ncbi:carbohydrate ABC transporter permease [Acuticoccus sp. MNP-M23]|uniref:carbohydrate ABC transporter permease n=1 Tax=Acuticoccus sp. MNP-M23 TaxID=3072793 RepID=UPI00281682C6|nr:carbohydrate ABC transporter permease [Acuticoccus sp. MNP-M23]WMS44012.1 carbohydrate ABC transporter permease [Acuticoccus sp. MNP-M23]